MDLVKENIGYEQLLGEKVIDNVTNDEFVIPDTHPDVHEVLLLDTNAKTKKAEVMGEKVYIEGELLYTVMYVTKEEEEKDVYCVKYSSPFANTIDVKNSQNEMECEVDCCVEHMDCSIVNERKIRIGGILKLKCEISEKCAIEIVTDVEDVDDIQFAKKPMEVDKIACVIKEDLLDKKNMEVPSSLPEIGEILKCDVILKKREVKVLDDSIKFCLSAGIKILYRVKDGRELCCFEDEIYMEKECEALGITSMMDYYSKFMIHNIAFELKDNEVGEAKKVDVDVLVKAYCKVMHKMQLDVIEDAYSPKMMLNMEKKNYEMNLIHKQVHDGIVVKDEIELDDDIKAKEVLFSKGEVFVTEKKIVEDKVIVEGILKVNLVYKTDNKAHYLCAAEEEFPFSCSLDITGTKIHMHCYVKCVLDELECELKRGEIKIRGNIDVYCRVCYNIHSEFLTYLEKGEGEIPKKKASITIYVVQSGDTLWKIAKKYHTTIEELCNVNELGEKDVKPDMKLIIPGRAVI